MRPFLRFSFLLLLFALLAYAAEPIKPPPGARQISNGVTKTQFELPSQRHVASEASPESKIACPEVGEAIASLGLNGQQMQAVMGILGEIAVAENGDIGMSATLEKDAKEPSSAAAAVTGENQLVRERLDIFQRGATGLSSKQRKLLFNLLFLGKYTPKELSAEIDRIQHAIAEPTMREFAPTSALKSSSQRYPVEQVERTK